MPQTLVRHLATNNGLVADNYLFHLFFFLGRIFVSSSNYVAKFVQAKGFHIILVWNDDEAKGMAHRLCC